MVANRIHALKAGHFGQLANSSPSSLLTSFGATCTIRRMYQPIVDALDALCVLTRRRSLSAGEILSLPPPGALVALQVALDASPWPDALRSAKALGCSLVRCAVAHPELRKWSTGRWYVAGGRGASILVGVAPPPSPPAANEWVEPDPLADAAAEALDAVDGWLNDDGTTKGEVAKAVLRWRELRDARRVGPDR